MRVLICAGGVIGASIAYFLSRRGVRSVVIERTGLACAASGKSGGFLALDWCDGTPLESLARRSFALHASLPEEIGGDWGYRRLATYAGFAGAQQPDRFTEALMRAAQARDAELRIGCVSGLVRDRGGAGVRGVRLDGETIEADAFVIAMGPWSILAAGWLPLPGVFGLK